MRRFAMRLSVMACRSAAPPGFWQSIDRRCGIGAGARTMLPSANCCMRWRRNGVGLAIGGCAKWRAARAW